MPKSLLHFKGQNVWVHDSYLEIILYFCSNLPEYQQDEQDWMVKLKELVPFYLQGFIPGAIDLKLNDNLTDPDRVDYFIGLLTDTRSAIAKQGEILDINLLNQVEGIKGEDAVLWEKPMATETLTDIIDQLISLIRMEDVSKSVANTVPIAKNSNNEQQSDKELPDLEDFRLADQLNAKSSELNGGQLYDGLWEDEKNILVEISKLEPSCKDVSFQLKELSGNQFSKLKKRLSPNDFKRLMTVSNIVEKTLGETSLYKTQSNQSAYYYIDAINNHPLLLCIGYGEIQPMRWSVTLESIHVLKY